MTNTRTIATGQRSALTPAQADTPAAQPAADGFIEFAALIAEHGPRVARLARRLLGWPSEVEDVAQEVFLSAWRALPEFRGQAALSTWLFRITVNACRRQRRRRLLRPWMWYRRPDVSEAVDIASGRSETAARVRAAVRALPARYREVVVLHYLENLNSTEIGQILELKPNTVAVRLNRARQCLREMLGDLLEEK